MGDLGALLSLCSGRVYHRPVCECRGPEPTRLASVSASPDLKMGPPIPPLADEQPPPTRALCRLVCAQGSSASFFSL
jgi:hypothetical protein